MSSMEFVPDLPPGEWASIEAEQNFRLLLERREALITLYRQGLYLWLSGAYPRPPRSPALYRARLERRHELACDKVEAEIEQHCKSFYVPATGAPDPEFELRWVRSDDRH